MRSKKERGGRRVECGGTGGHRVKGMIIQVEVTGSERDTW
jgi:hypothetical protein